MKKDQALVLFNHDLFTPSDNFVFKADKKGSTARSDSASVFRSAFHGTVRLLTVSMPVSYTHLDVYKRQEFFTPSLFSNLNIRPDKYIRSIMKDSSGNIWSGGYYNLKEID